MQQQRSFFFISLLALLVSSFDCAHAQTTAPSSTSTPGPVFTRESSGYFVLGKPLIRSGRVTDDIRFSLTLPAAVTRLGDNVSADLWISPAADRPISVCFRNLAIDLTFKVLDAHGSAVANLTPPFGECEYQRENRCSLWPNEQLHYTVPLTGYIALRNAGTYAVTAILKVDWKMYEPVTPIESNTVLWKVEPKP